MAENRGKLQHQMAHKTLVLHSQRVLRPKDLLTLTLAGNGTGTGNRSGWRDDPGPGERLKLQAPGISYV